jgi:DNA-binding response OmpR family regulator
MSHSPNRTPAAVPAKTKRKILVIDDDRDFVEAVRTLLRLNGHHVEVAFDGAAGLEAALLCLADAVVLDVALPKLNGYEVCRRIREQPLTKQPLIVAATGWEQLVDLKLGKSAGFDAYLVKPFDYEELSAVLENPSDRARG